MSSHPRPAAPPDDSTILWRRLFRLWVLMTGVWAFMGLCTTGLGSLSAAEFVYELLGLPFFFLVSGLFVRGMLLGTRVLIASAGRSSRSR